MVIHFFIYNFFNPVLAASETGYQRQSDIKGNSNSHYFKYMDINPCFTGSLKIHVIQGFQPFSVLLKHSSG